MLKRYLMKLICVLVHNSVRCRYSKLTTWTTSCMAN